MDELRQYLLGVISAAIICGMVQHMLPKGAIREWLQLIFGIFLTVTLLSPFAGGTSDSLLPSFPDYGKQARLEAAAGREMAGQAQKDIIKETLEAYVLDKAKDQGAAITVEIILSDGELPVPVTAAIHGEVTEKQKEMLISILEEDLGIPKEAQTWIGAA